MSTLKGTKNFYDFGVNDQVAYNLKSRYMYGLVEMGAFTSIPYNSTYGTLQRSSAKVFEGVGAGWVWESGINTIDGSTAPYPVSGIYFNNVYFPIGSAISGSYTSSWYVDYKNGRVVFNTDTPANTVVKCSYCARDVAVYLSDDPEWRIIVDNYMQRFAEINDNAPSGLASILKRNRVWLPAIVIDMKSIDTEPLQLGGGEIQNCSVFYHIFSDNAFSTKRLTDIILEQDETSFPLYNINSAPFPLNHNGSLASGAKDYKTLSVGNSPYFWTSVYLTETNGGYLNGDYEIHRSQFKQIAKVSRYNSTY